MLCSVSPLGELLSVACPTESNQRGRHPAITAFGSLALLSKLNGCLSGCFSLFQRVTFLCLPKDKVTKRKCTLASAFILRCSPKQAVTKLDLAAHKVRELLRDSNSRSLLLVLPALLGASDRGPKSYERHRLWIKEPNLSF